MSDVEAHFLARAYAAFADDPQPAADFLKWAAAQYGLPSTPTVLDIGTGPGTLLPILSAWGWQAHGLEPNPDFVAYARTQSAASVLRGGFGDLDEEARYELITALGSPLAYLPDFRERREALRRVKRALVPGGLAVTEFWNMPRVLRHYAEPSPITTELDGHRLTLTRRHTFDDHRAAVIQHERYALANECIVAELTHTLTMITIPELVALYQEVGFTAVATFNGVQAREAGRVRGSRGLILGVRP